MVTCRSSPGKPGQLQSQLSATLAQLKKENKKHPDLSRFSCGRIPTGSRLPLITYKTTNLLITASHEEGGGDADNNYLHLHPWIEEIKPCTECQFLNRSIRLSFSFSLLLPSSLSIHLSFIVSFFLLFTTVSLQQSSKASLRLFTV